MLTCDRQQEPKDCEEDGPVDLRRAVSLLGLCEDGGSRGISLRVLRGLGRSRVKGWGTFQDSCIRGSVVC